MVGLKEVVEAIAMIGKMILEAITMVEGEAIAMVEGEVLLQPLAGQSPDSSANPSRGMSADRCVFKHPPP